MTEEQWLTIHQAAELSAYNPDYVRQLVNAGKVEGRKFGPVWQVNRHSLMEYVKRMEASGERRGPKPASQA